MTRFLLPLALLAGVADAQMPMPDAPQECRAFVPAPGFETFEKASATTLAVGHAATLALMPAPGQIFTPPLNRPPEAGSNGGTFPLTIDKPGIYRIAISAGVWIDLIGGAARLESVAHMHGPACSGIAKIVDFRLAPGTYQVQLSATKATAIRVMVIAQQG